MHSQNSAWENDESRDWGSNRVTEKTTLVVARLQSVKYWPEYGLLELKHVANYALVLMTMYMCVVFDWIIHFIKGKKRKWNQIQVSLVGSPSH
jgi:hypothetical protein